MRSDNARLADRGRDGRRGYDEAQDYEALDDEAQDYEAQDYEDEEEEEEEPLPPRSAARAGLRYIAELTGKEPSGVVSLEPDEDGWVVGVEVIEDARIPSSADILALYQVQLGIDGALLAYRRTRRYARGRGDGGGEVT